MPAGGVRGVASAGAGEPIAHTTAMGSHEQASDNRAAVSPPRGTVVARLAPSPTGAQHLGNARTYLLAWLSARSRGGRVIVRLEDIDSPRVKPWAAQQALDDLRWLGLDWDEGPDVGGPHAPYVQTQRWAWYGRAIDELRRAQRVYPCTCTRSDVAAAASAPHPGQEGPVYPGTCASRNADMAPGEHGSFAWRFRASRQTRRFFDRVAGWQQCVVADALGDFVVARGDATPAYQLAVVVDDHHMGVNEVLRGDDLLPSTFRQLELYDFFGWEPPTFVHVPLVVGPDGRRLAKRHGDTRLATLREASVPPQRLLGLLAWSCGLRPTRGAVTARELLDGFDLAAVPREPFVLTDALWRELLA
jgi:glutamyl-tRNA synthetase